MNAEIIKFIRKNWLRFAVYGVLAGCLVDGILIEPHWFRIKRLSLNEHPTFRIVHISDFHYKGDARYLRRVVEKINALAPDAVCFTGDITENTRYLGDALNALAEIHAPVYGVPGNHEYWSSADFTIITKAFRKTGGDWLADQSVHACHGRLLIEGKPATGIDTRRLASDFAMPGRSMDWSSTLNTNQESKVPADSTSIIDVQPYPLAPNARRILLVHYPMAAAGLNNASYDLILAGHSHGGQVRIPWFGALIVPFGVNGFQKGMYSTPAGPLHVSPGLGTFLLPVRFFCRPEITLIEI